MWVIIGVVIACAAVLLGVLARWSPGKLKPFLDERGRPLADSISEKTRVAINGMEQGMFIRARDGAKPVLLFIHGGPGMPEYFLDQTHPSGVEDDFVVCWWEQRGAGMSYKPGIPPDSLTVEQLISDAIAVTDYLRGRFGQSKIYLLGHSWGSFLGIQVAERAPDRYHAYVGMGQVSWQLKSEVLSYEYELEQFRKMGNTGMVRNLERVPVTMTEPMPEAYKRLRDAAMHSIGVGTTRDMKSVVTGIFVPVWQTRAYTVKEKVDIGRGKAFSQAVLWDTFLNTNLTVQVPELEIPTYFCHGRYDYTVSYPMAKSYLEELKAPLKGFYTFEQSAHSPMFEEPDRMRRILSQDVLTGENRLADRTSK